MGSSQHAVSGDAPARAACLELRSPALEQGQGWGYMRIRFHWLEVRHLKREASQKHSQGPLGWLLKFFMHPEMRDVHFQSCSALELKFWCNISTENLTELGQVLWRSKSLWTRYIWNITQIIRKTETFFVLLLFFFFSTNALWCKNPWGNDPYYKLSFANKI